MFNKAFEIFYTDLFTWQSVWTFSLNPKNGSKVKIGSNLNSFSIV